MFSARLDATPRLLRARRPLSSRQTFLNTFSARYLLHTIRKSRDDALLSPRSATITRTRQNHQDTSKSPKHVKITKAHPVQRRKAGHYSILSTHSLNPRTYALSRRLSKNPSKTTINRVLINRTMNPMLNRANRSMAAYNSNQVTASICLTT